jgi:hypothetical protein
MKRLVAFLVAERCAAWGGMKLSTGGGSGRVITHGIGVRSIASPLGKETLERQAWHHDADAREHA